MPPKPFRARYMRRIKGVTCRALDATPGAPDIQAELSRHPVLRLISTESGIAAPTPIDRSAARCRVRQRIRSSADCDLQVNLSLPGALATPGCREPETWHLFQVSDSAVTSGRARGRR